MDEVQVAAELEHIADAHGGVIRPSDIVREAAALASPLHGEFEWDDSKAAYGYRLTRARQLISVVPERG